MSFCTNQKLPGSGSNTAESSNYVTTLFFFLRFYLFINERQREREKEMQKEKQAPRREPDLGLDPRSPGSGPGLKVVLNH